MKDKQDPQFIKINLETQHLKAGLYLVGTPIGYLKDISLRALETFLSVDVVACEDTRVTGKLLHHYGISVKKIKYNDHSDENARNEIINRIEAGEAVALCSDAGLPLIADPGYKLVRECVEKGLYVTSIPGANAALTGLQLSALPTDEFIFCGFLPNKQKMRDEALARWKGMNVVQVYYESATRVDKTLNAILSVMGDRHVVVARELTKLYEEVLSGTCTELLERLKEKALKGEVVLMVSGNGGVKGYSEDEIKELLAHSLQEQSLSVKDAVENVMQASGWAKKKVYQLALEVK